MKTSCSYLLGLMVLAAQAALAQFNYATNNGTITITGYTGSGGPVTIPSTINGLPVTSIGGGAFFWSVLTSITIPNSVTSIGADAFYGCNNLTSITIPDSVTSIGYEAFMQSGLTSAAIGSGVTSIGDYAFAWCFSLPSITVSTDNPDFVSVAGVLFNKTQTTLIAYPVGKSGSSYVIPSSVTTIEASAFFQCTSLASVTIPNSVTTIGEDAFDMCRYLAGVTIPSNVASIGTNAFASTSLASVTIPATATNIGAGAFAACSSLPAITVSSGNPAYISVAGVLFNQSQTTLIQYPAGSSRSSYVVPDGVNVIGAFAFESSSSLTSMMIPNSVTTIGEQAFDDCTGLSSVTMPNSVAILADYTFYHCTSLNAVYFQGNAPTADSTVFEDDGDVTAYYFEGTRGWGSTFAGVPATELPATPVAFTANPTSGVAPLIVSFTSPGADSAGNTIGGRSWAFGDGATSTAQSPSHTYTNAGAFYPALITTNSIGGIGIGSGPALITTTSAPLYSGLVLNGGFETGDFTGWTTGGNFTDTSVTTGSTYALSGTYGAALGAGGSLGYLSQTLATAAGGTYSLSLWLDSPDGQTPNELQVSWNGNTLFDQKNIPAIGWTNLQFLVSASGTSTVLEFGFRDDLSYLGLDRISVVPASGVGFTANPTNGVTPLSVQFSSPGVDSRGNTMTNWNWTFGDGTTSSAQSPSHVYGNAGIFQPSLVATNSLGFAVYGSGPTITVTAGLLSVAIQPTNNPVLVEAGGNVTFSVLVTGTGPFSYQWQLNGTNLPNGIITTVAGNGINASSGDGGSATNASFAPWAVAVDGAGNLFIADPYNNRIREVKPNGIITTVAGNGPDYPARGSYTGDGGPATNASLNGPEGVALDAFGNLFIADTENGRIRKVSTNGIITTVAGNGAGSYSGDGGMATNAGFIPWGVALDDSGNLLITDGYNNRIRKVSSNGIITTVAGNGPSGAPGAYAGDGGMATNAGLNYPQGVTIDASGNLFIADSHNNRVRKVSSNGIITTVAGNGPSGGTGAYSGDGGAATNASLNDPTGVSLDSDGNLLIADCYNNRIRIVSSNGIITTVAGSGPVGSLTGSFSGDGGPVINARFDEPICVAVDTSGNLFIADLTNERIRKVINPDQSVTSSSLVLNDVSLANAGAYDVVVSNPYGSVTSSVVNLSITPTNVEQTLFVGDNNGDILEFTPGGAQATFASGLSTVWGLTFNNAGDLFASDLSGHVYEFTPGGTKTTFASGLDNPAGLAFNSVGDLFVAEYGSGNIYEFTPSGVRSTFASGVGAYGLAFNSAGELFDATGLSAFPNVYEFPPSGAQSTFASELVGWPTYLAFNSAGDLFVVDQNSGNIFEFTPSGVRSTFASGLSSPEGLAFNGSGDLFVADEGNIYEYTPNGARSTFASGLYALGLAFQAVGSSIPLSITAPPASQTSIVGNAVTFTVVAAGTAPLSYQWYFDSGPLPGATNSSYDIRSVQLSNWGSYTVVVTNAYGSTNATATLELDWDISSQYSAGSNPNGAWSYGRKWTVDATAMDLFTVQWGGSGWYLGNVGNGGPSIQGGPELWAKANGNGYPAARWTCPASGVYAVSGEFTGADSRGVDSLVYVVTNGVTAFSGHVQGYGSAVPFTNIVVWLTNGASVDFVVVWGGGVYSEYGWTGLGAVVAPESATINPATVTLSHLNQTYDGTPKSVAVTTVPPGLMVNVTYNGSANPPTDAGNYTVVATVNLPSYQGSATATLVIGKATPVLTWTNPGPITYGAALTSNQLNAAASVPGGFAYIPTNGTVLSAGTNTLSVMFTPTNTTDYSTVTDAVALVVSRVPLTVTASNASRAYGQANPPFTGIIVGLTNGDNITASYNCGATNNSPVRPYPIVPSLVDPSNRQTNYTVTLVDGTLTITQAVPILTWTNPAAIPYGTALGTNQFNVTANVLGALAYKPTTGTVPDAGTNVLSVVFTPADTTDYSSVTDAVTLLVSRVPLTVIAGNASRAYGQANPPFTGIIVGLTNGDNITASYNCNATNTSPVGTYSIVPSLVDPNNRQSNYTVSLVDGTLTITQAVAVLTWTNPAPITYGTALGTNQLNATANVPGAFAYNPTNGAVLNAGSNLLSVVFTPTDANDYQGVTDSVGLIVLKATPLVTWPAPSPITYGTPLTSTQLNATANVPGSMTFTPAIGTILPPGSTNLSVTFTPTNTMDYTTASDSVTLVVLVGPLPDLQVVSVAIPAQAWTGRSFEASWVLTNTGTAAAIGPWFDRVYLSVTNQLQTNVDQVLGDFVFEGRLQPGQAVQLTQPVVINRTGITNGPYYVSVLADVSNSVFEVSRTNNSGTSSSNIYVQVTPLAKLTVASVDAPANGIGGQPVGVNWMVCNQGQADTGVPVWYDHLYLSKTTNLTGVVEDYGMYENPSYLAVNECYEQEATVILPIGISGPFYFIVDADSGGVEGKDSVTNTLGSTTLPMNIQLVTAGFLHVASVQVAPAPPTATWPGQPITCTYIVQNIGQASISGNWDDRITLSPVADYVNGTTTGFAYENDIGVAGPLAPGASYTNSAQFILPQSIAGKALAGTWYVVPVVDIHFAAGGAGFGKGNVDRDELAAPLDVSLPPPSDLQVLSVSAPTNAVEGQAINVGWTVANNGNNQTSSGYWYDGIYLSANTTFDASQSTLMGTYGHFGVLGLTSNYTQSVSVTVPANLFPTNMLAATNYLFVFADAGDYVAELDKTNNVLRAASPLVIQQAPPILPADLAVTAVVAPWTIIAGGPATISWSVTNQGAGVTSVGSWVDSVYLAAGPALNPASDQWLGDVPHSGTLASGGSYSQSQAFNLPYCAIGSYYVLVVVDSTHQVNEGGAVGNNVRASNPPMRIWPGNAARLQVAAVNPAGSVLAGAALTVSWSVTNLANATTNAPWVDAIYLSSTPQFVSSNAWLLGLYTNTGNLASGAIYTETQSPIVPRCFSGLYYVSVVTDAGNVVNGISCDANDWATAGAPVQVAPNGYASLQIASLSLPTVVTSGIPWTAQWTVTNAGPSAASGAWFDAVYASLSPALDANALLLGLFDYTNGLVSGASYAQSQPVALPQCLSGAYYIYVVADVSNRVNWAACQVNDKARSAGPLAVRIGPYPVLQVTSVGIPATAYAAQPMQISWMVTNAGSATANGPWLDSAYLSASSTFSPATGVLLGSYPYNSSLAAGAGYSQTAGFTLPDTTHGRFYAFIVTDSTNAVNECQAKTNNVAASLSVVNVPVTLYPDLRVTSVQVPAAALAGQPITVTWVVANEGTLSTGGTAWNDAVYLSLDEVLDPSDVRLGTFPNVSSLGVGQSYTNAATVVIPPGDAGPFYILVLADSGAALFEHLGYNDSLGWNADAMLVTLPPYADLAANNVSLAPSSGAPGTQTTIAWTVSNVSTNNTASTWTDAIYLSTNNFWDITAALVADVNHTGLAANSSYNGSWTGPLPALSPGAYHAILRADVRNSVPELDLSNNVVVSPTTIATDVPILPLGQPVTNQLATGAAHYYKITAAPGQTVRINLTGASASSDNQLFVRYGAMPDLGNFDFLYSNPLSPNQQIVIPSTQKGWYYIMVRGDNEPGGPLGYTLEADTVPFAITGLSQNHIGDNGQVTITLTGAQFQPGATVELISGTNAYFSQTNFFINATSIRARFVFTNAIHGIYDVVLTNPSNQSTTESQALTIETALPLTADVVPGLVNNHPRVGLPFEWSGTVVNAGNVDVPYLSVEIPLNNTPDMVLTPPETALLAQAAGSSGGVCNFMMRDVTPGATVPFSFASSGSFSQGFSCYIMTLLQSKQDFLSQMTGVAENVRQYLLKTPGALSLTTTNTFGIVATNLETLPADALTALPDPNRWEILFVQSLVTNGFLDAADLAFLPQPMPLYSSSTLMAASPAPKDLSSCQACLNDMYTCFLEAAEGCLACGQIKICYGPCLLAGVLLCEGHALGCEAWECFGPPPSTQCPSGQVLKPVAVIPYSGQIVWACVDPSWPNDPNEMQGPTGYSTAAFVGSQVPWQYTIYFENESNALAFARQIVITNVLDATLDIRTFRVSEIAFGNVTIKVPANRSFYQARAAAPSQNPTNVVVDVTAGVDVQHNTVFWTMNAIDLNTGQLVQDATEGVLPPDSPDPIGQGHVTYTIQPLAGVPTGTVVTNAASIVFDNNDPIVTNPTTNTVDAVAPTSSVLALPSAELTTNFTVAWFGTDDPNGSGVGSYDIYVSDNGGPWQPWQMGVSTNSAAYGGQPGHYYYFYSIAHDNAGNVEVAPSTYQAITLLSTNQAPSVLPIADQTIIVGDELVLTNVASGPNGSAGLNFSLGVAPPGAYIDPTNGVFSWSPDCAQGSTTNFITIWTTDNGTPPLSNSVSFLVSVPECIEASLGSTVMQTGQTSSVPVNLLSTTSLTNMTFNVLFPMDRFTNFALSVNSAQVLTQQLHSTTGSLQVSFTLPASQVLHGPTNVGQLSFSAVPTGHSAFVQLGITDVLGLKPDGSLAAKAYGLPGRIVLIGPEPLLQGWTPGPTNAVLEIYGNPGSNYLMSYSTNLPPTTWLPGWSILMTNLWETFEINAGHPQMFYRAQQQ